MVSLTPASQRATADRSNLLSSSTAFSSASTATSRLQGRHPSTSYPAHADPGSPFAINMSQSASSSGGGGGAQPRYTLNNPNGLGDNGFGGSVHNNSRTRAALGEHDFLQSTGSTLDGYIALGQATMMNLGNQRDMLKGQSAWRSRHDWSRDLQELICWLAQAHNGGSCRRPTRSACRATRSSTSSAGQRPTSTSSS